MTWLDWCIVVLPVLVVLAIGLKSQKYVKSVADFLAAGRVAGRYVICVASGEANMGLVSLVAMWEMNYAVGYGIGFWGTITAPLALILGLTGYCTYRFRETRAMTMGQFLEMRYSRGFRIFVAILQSISGVINYAIFPAVGARCIMYFFDLPVYFYLGGWKFSTFGLLLLLFLGVAVWIITMGGQITIMVTDCVQGLLSYPFYAIIVIYIIWRFSWYGEIIPALMDRPPGKSMLNPYDVSQVRTFNLFYIFAGMFGSVFNRMSWSGAQGYNAAARNPHEQKMGAVLGTWRNGFSNMMYLLLGVAAFTFINHLDFRPGADRVHQQLTIKTIQETAAEKRFDTIRPDVIAMAEKGEITPKMKMILRKTGKFDVGKPIGIDANYTKGDRILAWSVFLWSFGFRFTLCFICITIWNAFYRWPAHWWAIKMHITSVYVPCVVAIVSTVWFLIGGTLDLRRLFKALDAKIVDYSDDGRVDHSKIDE